MSLISRLLRLVFRVSILFLLPLVFSPLFIQHADAASVTLAWDPNSEPDVAGYKLYYGKASGTYESVVDVGNQTTYTILGLLDRETYYFAVTAYNVYGLESGFSDEVSYLISLPLQPGTASVTLAWDPNTEPDIGGYKLYYGKTSGTYESVIDVGNQTMYSISGLEDAKTYYFVVTAYDILGHESDFSSELRYPEPFSMTISLSPGLNLISLPLEPLNPSISALTEKLSPCLLQVLAYTRDTEGYDTWLYYDPLQLDQNTLSLMEPGKGYWVEMICPGEMTVVGNRTTNPINLTPGLNLVGYNSLTPLPVSQALSSITNKYTMVWAYKDGQWTYYDPADETGSTLQALTPGSGYWIEAIEETTWGLP